MDYIPVLLLHIVSLGYLLLKPGKSRQTWLFCGWLAGMSLMTASQTIARASTSPGLSSYVGWWGGVGGAALALIAFLQFAYYFPHLRYPREARAVLIGSLGFTGFLFGWMVWETLTFRGYLIYTETVEAFSPRVRWIIYSFEHFVYGSVVPRDAGLGVSFKIFDLWQIIGYLWIFVIWLRKTVQFAHPTERTGWRWVVTVLSHPQGEEARLARAWALLTILAPLPVASSVLEGINLLPPGFFAIVYLLVLFVIMLTYVNYAPEPTSFMVRLVGISLVTVLVVLGLVSSYTLRATMDAYDRMRRVELAHVRTLITAERLDTLPADVLYVAERPAKGLFATEYRILAARPSAPTAATLAAQDAWLQAGLIGQHYPARFATLHEHPWLGLEGVIALESKPEAIASITIPETVTAYRGAAAPLATQITRYTLPAGETLYEVGYAYYDERLALHRQARPLLALLLASTVMMLVLFPQFFNLSLITPLQRLLRGVERVDQGELDIAVPVFLEDEIGRLTHAFNRMVASLRSSEAHLRALNQTLEQRVADRVRDLATLYQVATLIGQSSTLDELFPAALTQIVPAVDGSAGAILRFNKDKSLTLAAHYQLSASLQVALVNRPIWRQVCERKEALLIPEQMADVDATGLLSNNLPYPTLVAVPIFGPTSCLGVLAIFGERPYLFNLEDIELLGSLAEQMGIAIENAQLRERAKAALVVEERQRLARDLHDSVTQLIYSQTLFVDAAAKTLKRGQIDQAKHYLSRLGDTAGQALREMRLMIYRLRPTDLTAGGLGDALQRRLELVERRAGLRTHLVSKVPGELPSEWEESLYRIAEEGLNNALKHAAATEVWVRLEQVGAELLLSVCDNGRGFDPETISPGMGLQNLRERAVALNGTLVIESAPGDGTHIIVRLPWANRASRELTGGIL